VGPGEEVEIMRLKGFTLAEVMIVVVIIGILAAIAIPRVTGFRQEAQIAEAKSELNMLKVALDSYYVHNDTYPASLSSLTQATPNIIGASLPQDPLNGDASYGYAVSANGDHFVVYSPGTAGSGSASVSDTGTVTEANGASCIFAASSAQDTTGP